MEQKTEMEGVQEAEAAPGRGGKKELDILKERVTLNLSDTRFKSQGNPNLSALHILPWGPPSCGSLVSA